VLTPYDCIRYLGSTRRIIAFKLNKAKNGVLIAFAEPGGHKELNFGVDDEVELARILSYLGSLR
jgi:hypothetical protein